MNDRELLELAAKAADLTVRYVGDGIPGGSGGSFYLEPSQLWWNPLEDDGDAMRLAVKLCLMLNVGTEATFANDKVNGETVHWAREQHADSDPYAATRRAIVRAAVEVGKSTAAPNSPNPDPK